MGSADEGGRGLVGWLVKAGGRYKRVWLEGALVRRQENVRILMSLLHYYHWLGPQIGVKSPHILRHTAQE